MTINRSLRFIPKTCMKGLKCCHLRSVLQVKFPVQHVQMGSAYMCDKHFKGGGGRMGVDLDSSHRAHLRSTVRSPLSAFVPKN